MSILQKNRRSQVSNEFIILLGFSFLSLVIFLSIISDEIASISYQKEYRSIRDLGFSVQHEVMIAADVKEGYERHFTLPEKVNGFGYSISNTNRQIVLLSENKGIEQVFLIPYAEGNIVKGANCIRKTGGVIHIN
ncbi:hypothetical protein JXB31_04735 [Candidatus Woesearchaeota archaeon]|nr:hypothetical protein [Candidatus Woesearchaeota archaeon]